MPKAKAPPPVMIASLPDSRTIVLEHMFEPLYPERFQLNADNPASDFRNEFGDTVPSHSDVVSDQAAASGVDMSAELALKEMMAWYLTYALTERTSASQSAADIGNMQQTLNPFWLRSLREEREGNLTLARGFKALKRFGMATVNEYKNLKDLDAWQDWSQMESTVPRDLLQRIGRRHIEGYAKIEGPQGLQFALERFGPCIVTLPKYNSTMQWFLVQPEHATEEIRNMREHTVLVVGWDPLNQHFILRDVNGSKWGVDGCTNWNLEHFNKHLDLRCILSQKDVNRSPLCQNLPIDELGNRYHPPSTLCEQEREYWIGVGEKEAAQKYRKQIQQLQQQLQVQGPRPATAAQSQRPSLAPAAPAGARLAASASATAAAPAATDPIGRGGPSAAESNRLMQVASIAADMLMTQATKRAESKQYQQLYGENGGGGEAADPAARLYNIGAAAAAAAGAAGEGAGNHPLSNRFWAFLNKQIDQMQGDGDKNAANAREEGGGDTSLGTFSPPMKTAMKLLNMVSRAGGIGAGGPGGEVTSPQQREYRQYLHLRDKFASQPKHPYDEMMSVGGLIASSLQKGVHPDEIRRTAVLHVFDTYIDPAVLTMRKHLVEWLDPANPAWIQNLQKLTQGHPWLGSKAAVAAIAAAQPVSTAHVEEATSALPAHPPMIGAAAPATVNNSSARQAPVKETAAAATIDQQQPAAVPNTAHVPAAITAPSPAVPTTLATAAAAALPSRRVKWTASEQQLFEELMSAQASGERVAATESSFATLPLDLRQAGFQPTPKQKPVSLPSAPPSQDLRWLDQLQGTDQHSQAL
jgi:hypothetical protein